jgi:hypothetical protein
VTHIWNAAANSGDCLRRNVLCSPTSVHSSSRFRDLGFRAEKRYWRVMCQMDRAATPSKIVQRVFGGTPGDNVGLETCIASTRRNRRFLICRRTEGESDRLKLVTKRNHCARCSPVPSMDEGRQRVLGIMTAILASLRMQTADDLFGGPQGGPVLTN